MRLLKRFPIRSLLLANALAFGLLLGAEGAVASSAGDFCDELSAGSGFDCVDGSDCFC